MVGAKNASASPAGPVVQWAQNSGGCHFSFNSGKLRSKISLEGLSAGDALPATLTVSCRGQAYKDTLGITRHEPAVVTDPATGTIYNIEHLRNGDSFVFPSGEKAIVKKETFVILATAQWVHVFQAQDVGE